ncbi:MAG TPA: ferritin-like domain-containing protein [Solirubrobacteraceae bacterium]|nr:ferritin-like domain-containing protein [Solirubrobacteraceae bacterium]
MTMTRAQLIVRAAVLGGAAAAGPLAARALADIKDDLELLEYLLTMEYVQSGLYREAIKQVSLSEEVSRLARELRDQEVEHVDALRATIEEAGGNPPDRLPLDFGSGLASEAAFLKLANTLEDTAASAYNGAAPRLESREFLAVFTSIGQIEARHAALVRLAREKPPAPLAFDKASTRVEVRTAIRDFEVR